MGFLAWIVVGAIDRPGLLAFVGVTPGDGPAQVELIARKIAELRILRDEHVPSPEFPLKAIDEKKK